MSSFSKQAIRILALILMINIVGMWVIVLIDHQKLSRLQMIEKTQRVVVPDEKKETGDIDTRLGKVEETQEVFRDQLDALESSVSGLATGTKTTTIVRSGGSTSTAQKEYTVYLGTGGTNRRDWTTVQETTIALDTSKYQHVSAVYFEAALSAIGGEVYAQLIDAENMGVISPMLVQNSQTPTWKTTKMNLTSGNHLYVVQLKSSSGETVTMSGARIRIIAD